MLLNPGYDDGGDYGGDVDDQFNYNDKNDKDDDW